MRLTRKQVVVLQAVAIEPIDLTNPTEVMVELTRLGLLCLTPLSQCEARCALTDAGREALAEYDREWVTVRREDLDIAAGSLAAEIREYDDLYEGRPNLLARRDYEREALKRLRAAWEAAE